MTDEDELESQLWIILGDRATQIRLAEWEELTALLNAAVQNRTDANEKEGTPCASM